MQGYALSRRDDGGWTYRAVLDSWPLADGETFYADFSDFPQDARDWFDTHTP